MLVLNVVWVFSPDRCKVLMCKRHKEPYLGLYNLVGGKVEPDERGLDAAHRELEEETGITRKDLAKELHHLMDCVYYNSVHQAGTVRVEMYVGKLIADVPVRGDEKELVWIDVTENLFDMARFAGEGNLGHMYEQIKLRPQLI